MAEPIISLDSITFRRTERQILSDISWRIEDRQHWALLGANGSGKTSLLKIITGYEWPTAGTVSVLGEKFGNCQVGELRKTIGWVSNSVMGQFPGWDKAIDIVVSGIDASLGLYRNIGADEYVRADKSLELVGGSNFSQQRYDTLSQGEQQRVLIARALVNEPKLLVLDEPCVGLDPAAREKFLQDTEKLAKKDNCPGIILVTHHIEEIMPWIDHVLVLKDGRVLSTGRTEDVIWNDVLSAAFGCECKVQMRGQRYRLDVDI